MFPKGCIGRWYSQAELLLSTILSEDHRRLLEDCEITLINKTDSSDPTRREFFWMYELKTFVSLDLNICDIV